MLLWMRPSANNLDVQELPARAALELRSVPRSQAVRRRVPQSFSPHSRVREYFRATRDPVTSAACAESKKGAGVQTALHACSRTIPRGWEYLRGDRAAPAGASRLR